MSGALDTAAALGASAGLPSVDRTREPAWVRNGSPSTQKAYTTALAFEQTLVEQLARSLVATSGLGGEPGQAGEGGSESGPTDAGESQLASMMPQALAGGVMQAGGLGLAAQMTHQLEGAAAARASGGTGAAAAGGAHA